MITLKPYPRKAIVDQQPAPPRFTPLLVIALAAATLMVFGSACQNPFVNYDDGIYVTQNRHVLAGLSSDTIRWAFTATRTGNWHPLTWLSLQIDAQLFGMDAFGFHLTSVLLHTTNTLLLYWLLGGWTGAPWRSALVAGLFGLHPLHVESVAWVAERKDVLSSFFFLLTLAAYTWYVQQPGVGRYLLVLVLDALGLMSKPMLVTLPFLLLLLDFWPLDRQSANYHGVRVASPLLEKLPLLILAAVFSMVALWAQAREGTTSAVEQLSVEARAENACVAYVGYLARAVWPAGLAVYYPHPYQAYPGGQIAIAIGVVTSISIIALGLRRQRPYLLVGWLWYLGTLVPVIGLVQVGGQALADRYTYIPLIGIFVAAAWLGADLIHELRLSRAMGAIIGMALLGAFAAASWMQIGYWRSSRALWEHALEVTGRNYTLDINLGEALLAAQRWEQARFFLHDAVVLKPDGAGAHFNLGIIAHRTNRPGEAMREYERALACDPQFVPAHINLAALLAAEDKYEQAAEHYRKALEIDPESREAHQGFQVVLQRIQAQGRAGK